MEFKHTVPKLEEIIVSLIEKDVMTMRHSFNLHEIIFWHIGFREHEITDELRNWYVQQTQKVSELKEPVNRSDYEFLAMEIYNGLKARLWIAGI